VTYAVSAALSVGLARRYVGDVPRRAAAVLALLPLVFTGKAVLRGELYGPADLYSTSDPWRAAAEARGAPAPANPILSDLAFANLPWRAAVREAVANGRVPFWNRFVLAGSPLLATAQAGVFHPATWLGLWLPVPLSFTFSCAFTLFLALLSAFLFFSDFRLGPRAAMAGAVGWGFSTYVVFWVGWSVGPSTATLPLLLLGLRRLARAPGRASIGLTTAALWLSFCGGHPESFFHGAAAGSVYFVWELAGTQGRRAGALAAALGAGSLAFLLCGAQLFPLLEAIPRSAEYRARRAALDSGASRQSVPLSETARRLLPDVLPFAHGVFGKSPVQTPRNDGSGMPIGYAGAVLFPLALAGLGLRGATSERGRSIFLFLALAGLAYGASAPGLHDLTARLPGFELALNYRLVFLAGLGLSGLAAFGVARLETDGRGRRLAVASACVAAALLIAFFLARPVFADRGLPSSFVTAQFLFEIVPVVLLAAVAASRRPPREIASAAVVLLAAQRFLEMRGVYPTLPAASLAPAIPGLGSIARAAAADPGRVVAAGTILRPNGATLYALQDVRGYESLVLGRFADTYPLWCRAQPASYNLVTDLGAPFLGFLNARWAVGGPRDPVPAGWRQRFRDADLAVFENPRALPRAFIPRNVRRERDPARRLEAMAREVDFGEIAWLSEPGLGPAEESGGRASLDVREVGPDLVLEAKVERRAFVATSLPDWPGWRAIEDGHEVPLETVNHAFIGFWLPPGEHSVRIRYRPAAWGLGLASSAAGLVAALAMGIVGRSGRRPA